MRVHESTHTHMHICFRVCVEYVRASVSACAMAVSTSTYAHIFAPLCLYDKQIGFNNLSQRLVLLNVC